MPSAALAANEGSYGTGVTLVHVSMIGVAGRRPSRAAEQITGARDEIMAVLAGVEGRGDEAGRRDERG